MTLPERLLTSSCEKKPNVGFEPWETQPAQPKASRNVSLRFNIPALALFRDTVYVYDDSGSLVLE